MRTAEKQGNEFFDVLSKCDDYLDDAVDQTVKNGDKFPEIILTANEKGGASYVKDVVNGVTTADDILANNRIITQGTDEWNNVSKYYDTMVDTIKNENKGVNSLGGNVSYTETLIDGKGNAIKATSGQKSIDGFAPLVGDGTVSTDPERLFTTEFVSSSGEVTDSLVPNISWNRAVDTEAKTLEQVARELGATKAADGSINWGNTSATGTINLYTVYEPCHSCRGVIDQFKEAYPNITINVFWKS